MKKINIVKFQTYEGDYVLNTCDRMSYWPKAVKKAKEKGYTSLIAIDPAYPTPFDYTDLLHRN